MIDGIHAADDFDVLGNTSMKAFMKTPKHINRLGTRAPVKIHPNTTIQPQPPSGGSFGSWTTLDARRPLTSVPFLMAMVVDDALELMESLLVESIEVLLVLRTFGVPESCPSGPQSLEQVSVVNWLLAFISVCEEGLVSESKCGVGDMLLSLLFLPVDAKPVPMKRYLA